MAYKIIMVKHLLVRGQIWGYRACEPPFHYQGLIDLFYANFVKLSIEKPSKSPKKSIKPK